MGGLSRPGLLVELLKVEGGIVKQWVFHFHFPGLRMDTQRGTGFVLLVSYDFDQVMFVQGKIVTTSQY